MGKASGIEANQERVMANKLAEQIALWADRLRDMSAMGLRFSRNSYDREHYRQIQEMALAMMGVATGQAAEALEPLRRPIFSRPTPFVAADAAIVDDGGRILLIRRADNQLWALPGGALEVGETAAAGAVREAYEETGLRCRAVALVGVFDSRLLRSGTPLHLYHLVFLCQPLPGADATPGPTQHAAEVLDVRWFAEQDLPTDLDPAHASRLPEVYRVWRGDGRAYFDL
jgi:ADP-ribose pyrophosphatase YjhB (NUDIX family)